MTKTQKGLAVAGVLLGGGLIYLLATRSRAEEAPPQIEPPGTPDEPAPEIPTEEPVEPTTRKPVVQGYDRFPRFSVATVSTSAGPETFEKEFDTDLQEIRWINFKNPNYGSYRDIGRLAARWTPIRIAVAGSGVLWEAPRFTPWGVRYFKLNSADVPLSAMVV